MSIDHQDAAAVLAALDGLGWQLGECGQLDGGDRHPAALAGVADQSGGPDSALALADLVVEGPQLPVDPGRDLVGGGPLGGEVGVDLDQGGVAVPGDLGLLGRDRLSPDVQVGQLGLEVSRCSIRSSRSSSRAVWRRLRAATSSWMAVSSLGLVTLPEAARSSSLWALRVTMSISSSSRACSRWRVVRLPRRSAASWSTTARPLASSASRASSGREPRRAVSRSTVEWWRCSSSSARWSSRVRPSSPRSGRGSASR